MNIIKTNNSLIVFKKEGMKLFKDSIIKNNYSKLFVLVDENTKRYCLSFFLNHFEKLSDFNILEIKSGEINKNISTCENLWNQLSQMVVR